MDQSFFRRSMRSAIGLAERVGLVASQWRLHGIVDRIALIPVGKNPYFIVVLSEPADVIRIPIAGMSDSLLEAVSLTAPGDSIEVIIEGKDVQIDEGQAKLISFSNGSLAAQLQSIESDDFPMDKFSTDQA